MHAMHKMQPIVIDVCGVRPSVCHSDRLSHGTNRSNSPECSSWQHSMVKAVFVAFCVKILTSTCASVGGLSAIAELLVLNCYQVLDATILRFIADLCVVWSGSAVGRWVSAEIQWLTSAVDVTETICRRRRRCLHYDLTASTAAVHSAVTFHATYQSI